MYKITLNYRYSQHLKWSKLFHFPEEQVVSVSSQEEQSSEDETDEGTDGNNEDGGVTFWTHDDDVRIDDVIQELVNKESSESKVAQFLRLACHKCEHSTMFYYISQSDII